MKPPWSLHGASLCSALPYGPRGIVSNERRFSTKPFFDAVGTFVGHRGERVKRMIDELGGEKIDVVLWSESVEQFIPALLGPLTVLRIALDEAGRQANVTARRDFAFRSPSLALRSELLANLTGWRLNVEFAGQLPPPA